MMVDADDRAHAFELFMTISYAKEISAVHAKMASNCCDGIS